MKRIVICADGTWNQADQVEKESGKRRPTNVTKVARAVLPRTTQNIDQVVFYHDGIGTSGGWIDQRTDGAFGHGMAEHIRALYRFLVFNYVVGDEIYLFGFSRGAFTVRSFTGFLHCVGLVEKDDDFYAPDLFELYRKCVEPDSEVWKKAHRRIRDKRPAPPIKFIGVWDTVGALGAPGALGQLFNRDKYRFHEVGLNDDIANVAHALAIDERRRPFAPSLYELPPKWTGRLDQAWFTGVHSNIGGGYDPDGLANEALHWILGEARYHGLELDWSYLNFFEPHYDSKLQNSMSAMYKVMGPIVREIGRHSPRGECLHASVQQRVQDPSCNYRPVEVLRCLQSGSLPVICTRKGG